MTSATAVNFLAMIIPSLFLPLSVSNVEATMRMVAARRRLISLRITLTVKASTPLTAEVALITQEILKWAPQQISTESYSQTINCTSSKNAAQNKELFSQKVFTSQQEELRHCR
jgi:hypothetical protein